MSAVLAPLDFFSLPMQRTCVNVCAAVCGSLSTDDIDSFRASIRPLANLLQSHDARVAEGATVCFERVVMNIGTPCVEAIVDAGVVDALMNIAATEPSRLVVGPAAQTRVIRTLASLCRYSPKLVPTLLLTGVAGTIAMLLSGGTSDADTPAGGSASGSASASASASAAAMSLRTPLSPSASAASAASATAQHSSPEYVAEILSLTSELLPPSFTFSLPRKEFGNIVGDHRLLEKTAPAAESASENGKKKKEKDEDPRAVMVRESPALVQALAELTLPLLVSLFDSAVSTALRRQAIAVIGKVSWCTHARAWKE
jgi:hypothetical protein